ncbi:hypothetical protein ACJMK2_031425 [Sinanodonta woodiana]|uniref:MD-2-related lipid-recognition domain-containing protein n=1 Tax=Sinanodonta woodiana TaxID=1069815 RepID=A0ABD3X273_SINWO
MKLFLPCIFLIFSAAANNVQYFEEIEDNRTQRDHVRLKSFSWMNCGDPSKSSIVAKSLTVTPDPIQTPGSVNIGFQLTVNTDVNSPLQADLVLYKKLENQWVKIPCLGFLGSCHYDDLCELLDMISDCPEPIVSSGLSCYCPFKTGNYNMPSSEFDINVEVASGDYHAVGNATSNGKPAGCLDLYLSFSE